MTLLCEIFTPFHHSTNISFFFHHVVNNQYYQVYVGGKHFEVSRDLMEAHTETMLGKLVSETWQKDPEEPVFIDRDGDIFAHVLNYLRYGRIELPPTIPKSSLERDLDFYGLATREGEIMERCFADEIASSRQDRDNAKKHLNDAQHKYAMRIFAVEVYHHYILKKRKNERVVGIYLGDILVNEDLKDRKNTVVGETENALFLNSLDKYFGLRMAKESECKKDDISMSTKKNCPNLWSNSHFYVIRK